MLIDEFKKQNMVALKEKDNIKRGILSVVINKYMLLSTNAEVKSKGGPTDNDLIAIISKTIKELEEEKEGYIKQNNMQRVNDVIHQIETISVYLPKMLSDDEVKEIVLSLEDKSIGNVMKYFKINYAGKVDMSKVGSILKSL